MNHSPQLDEFARLRVLLDAAQRLAWEMSQDCPMDSDAYDALDDLLELYLGDNAFQQLTIVEKEWREYQDRKAAKEYDRPLQTQRFPRPWKDGMEP